MKRLKQVWGFVFIVLLCSCGGGGKKVLVMASGEVRVSDNIITLQPGNTHTEQDLSVDGDKLVVNTPSGSSDFNLTESGYYILNLKKDTIVGSYQRTGTDETNQRITQEDLKKRIDSLQQLLAGSNASEEKKNYCIPPNQITKISSNPDAQVIGPYKKMPRSFEAGRDHEIYKFYTSKEMQEIIDKLKPMVGGTDTTE